MRLTFSYIILLASLASALPTSPSNHVQERKELSPQEIEKRQFYRDNGGNYRELIPEEIEKRQFYRDNGGNYRELIPEEIEG
jgi:hypothetical protein